MQLPQARDEVMDGVIRRGGPTPEDHPSNGGGTQGGQAGEAFIAVGDYLLDELIHGQQPRTPFTPGTHGPCSPAIASATVRDSSCQPTTSDRPQYRHRLAPCRRGPPRTSHSELCGDIDALQIPDVGTAVVVAVGAVRALGMAPAHPVEVGAGRDGTGRRARNRLALVRLAPDRSAFAAVSQHPGTSFVIALCVDGMPPGLVGRGQPRWLAVLKRTTREDLPLPGVASPSCAAGVPGRVLHRGPLLDRRPCGARAGNVLPLTTALDDVVARAAGGLPGGVLESRTPRPSVVSRLG